MPEKADTLSIYDVLRALVAKASWPSEAEILRMRKAIDVAEQSRVFGAEGLMRL